MLVKDLMSKQVVSLAIDNNVGDAMDLMRDNGVRHLPIVDDQGNLTGLITERDLLEKVFPPKQCITQFQFNLLCRTPVENAMNENPKIIAPEASVEQAALLLQKNKVSCLPVVVDRKVVGMLSEVDIIKAFIHSLGLGQPGLRLTVQFARRYGFLADLVGIIDKYKGLIEQMVTFDEEVVLKIRCTQCAQLIEELKAQNYQINHVSYEEEQAAAAKA